MVAPPARSPCEGDIISLAPLHIASAPASRDDPASERRRRSDRVKAGSEPWDTGLPCPAGPTDRVAEGRLAAAWEPPGEARSSPRAQHSRPHASVSHRARRRCDPGVCCGVEGPFSKHDSGSRRGDEMAKLHHSRIWRCPFTPLDRCRDRPSGSTNGKGVECSSVGVVPSMGPVGGGLAASGGCRSRCAGCASGAELEV